MLEKLIQDLTDAIKADTASREAMFAAAQKAGGGKAAPKAAAADDEKPAPKAAPKAAAKPKPAAKAPAGPEARDKIDAKELRALAGEYLGTEDEDERALRRANCLAGLEHIGFAQLADIKTAEDRIRFACYLDQWISGAEEVDFEASDEACGFTPDAGADI